MAQETAQMRLAREAAEERGGADGEIHPWPVDGKGNPMVLVSYASSELIPTVPFGNCTVGPLKFTGFVEKGPEFEKEVKAIMAMTEKLVFEEYETIQRAVNARVAQPKRA